MIAEGDNLGPELAKRWNVLARWAAAGDEQASQGLIEVCQVVPQVWQGIFIVSGLAQRAWIDLLAPEKPGSGITRRTIEEEIERKRREVAGEDPSPLGSLLAERVALCWVAATYADAEYTRRLKEGMSFRKWEHYSKRCEQMNRQLLKSTESQARVRWLLTPMQINIGQNQINLTE
jgi:hypothetical protein